MAYLKFIKQGSGVCCAFCGNFATVNTADWNIARQVFRTQARFFVYLDQIAPDLIFTCYNCLDYFYSPISGNSSLYKILD